jgi:hypothetical protein
MQTRGKAGREERKAMKRLVSKLGVVTNTSGQDLVE